MSFHDLRSHGRRRFLQAGGAGLALGLAGCAGMPAASGKKVVVIGGGYGGATAAKYIRMLDPSIEVTMIEPNTEFISCPMSNLVLGGFSTLPAISTPYTALTQRHGVRWVRDTATAIDLEKKLVRVGRGDSFAYDRLIVSPASTSCGMRSRRCAPRKPRTRCCTPGRPVRRPSAC